MKKWFKYSLILTTLVLVLGGAWAWFQLRNVPESTAETTFRLPENAKITRLVVHKKQRKMLAYQHNKLLKTYDISLGFQPVGHKQFEGDGKTPEGVYRINERNARSAYHKNLGISYPNQQDIQFAKSHNKSAGGLIKIHGLPNGMGALGRQHLRKDWTEGCIAVTNDEMDELFAKVVHNAPIEIYP